MITTSLLLSLSLLSCICVSLCIFTYIHAFIHVHTGIEELGLHFESVGEAHLGAVNDHNKAEFVKLKINLILVKNREVCLLAIKRGFTEALEVCIYIYLEIFYVHIQGWTKKTASHSF
jgi:hypothetical protein